jgi:hypothetical protein
MRVVLRDTRTGLYLREIGHWTENLRDAQMFRHSAEAMDKARNGGLKGLEVMLVFEEPQYNVTLPLPPG